MYYVAGYSRYPPYQRIVLLLYSIHKQIKKQKQIKETWIKQTAKGGNQSFGQIYFWEK
jgi:hypothetical protein